MYAYTPGPVNKLESVLPPTKSEWVLRAPSVRKGVGVSVCIRLKESFLVKNKQKKIGRSPVGLGVKRSQASGQRVHQAVRPSCLQMNTTVELRFQGGLTGPQTWTNNIMSACYTVHIA